MEPHPPLPRPRLRGFLDLAKLVLVILEVGLERRESSFHMAGAHYDTGNKRPDLTRGKDAILMGEFQDKLPGSVIKQRTRGDSNKQAASR